MKISHGRNGKKEERDWIDSRQLSLEDMEDEIKYHQFLQFIFYKQWNDIKKYAEKHHVKILGDIPFYVGLIVQMCGSIRINFY